MVGSVEMGNGDLCENSDALTISVKREPVDGPDHVKRLDNEVDRSDLYVDDQIEEQMVTNHSDGQCGHADSPTMSIKIEPLENPDHPNTLISRKIPSDLCIDDQTLKCVMNSHVKPEAIPRNLGYEDGVSILASTELYEDHQVKEELVIGPTVIQKPIMNFADIHDETIETAESRKNKQKTLKGRKEKANSKTPKQSDNVLNQYKKEIVRIKTITRNYKTMKSTKKQSNNRKSLETNKEEKENINDRNSKTLKQSNNCVLDQSYISYSMDQSKEESIQTIRNNYELSDLNFEKPAPIPSDFVCEHCQKCFKTKKSLISHLKAHILQQGSRSDRRTSNLNFKKPSFFVCDYCQKSFKSKRGLIYHIINHQKLSICTICDMKYEEFALKNHLKTHTQSQSQIKNRELKCKTCLKTFSYVSSLRRHEKLIHSEITLLYSCDQCEKQFKSERYLNYHKILHDKENNMKHICKCGKQYYNRSNYNQHRRGYCSAQDYSISDCAVTCEDCHKGFPNTYRLMIHKRSVHKNRHNRKRNRRKYVTKPKFVYCDFCNKRFGKKYRLMKHLSYHMDITLPYPCGMCHKKYAVAAELEKHMLSHSITERNQYFSCKKCKRLYLNECSLKIHELRCSTQLDDIDADEDKPFLKKDDNKNVLTCMVCQMQFSSLRAFTRHWNNSHLPGMTIKCQTCKTCFANNSRLKSHMRIHAREKNHLKTHTRSQSRIKKSELKCKTCLKTFSFVSNLKRHEKLIHSKITLLYSCDQCEKQFKSKRYLNYHKILHDKENNMKHICKCGKKYYNRSSYNRHRWGYCSAQDCSISDCAVTCEDCHKGFPNTYRLIRHKRTVHKTKKKQNNQKRNRKIYVKNPKFIYCDFCNKRFREKYRLMKHLSYHMDITLPYPCGMCHKKYAVAAELEKHMLSHSITERNQYFSCKKCKRLYLNECSVKVHELRCSIQLGDIDADEDKPFLKKDDNKNVLTCMVCQRQFNSIRSFTKHWNHCHLPGMTIKCQTCKTGFANNIRLKRHMRIHERDNNKTSN